MTRNSPRLGFPNYRDLTEADINCDLHLHTVRTDGKAGIAEAITHASRLGLRRIAFTEHVRKSTEWFQSFVEEVRKGAVSHPEVEVLVGCEAKALDPHGTLDVSPEILAECDIVLGSVHRFPAEDGGYLDFGSLLQDEMLHIEFALAMGLLDTGPIDVLAHPGGMYARRFKTDFPTDMQAALMNRALQRGIAIEINSSYLHNASEFLALCAIINPTVSIGSDMHDLQDLGSCRDLVKSHREGKL